jgi:hypothetical protein
MSRGPLPPQPFMQAAMPFLRSGPAPMPSLGVAPPLGQMSAAGAVLQAASVDPMLLQTAHGTDLITTGLAKFNGSIRYPQYQANLRLLAEKVLTRDNQALLLSILNTSQARMQDPSAAPNVVGITWDKVRFVGQEAVVLLAAAKTSQGVQTQLMDTPILPLYEWIFTLDEYLGSCWAQVNRCIQHIKAVRRQADGVRSNEVVVDQRGFLEPMLMSEGDIMQMAMQIPPPDFLLWEFRNELRTSEPRRFVKSSTEGTIDRLTGMGGIIDQRLRNMTFVEDPSTYSATMTPKDMSIYAPGASRAGAAQMLMPKTPYQRCIEEAVDLSYEQVNTCRALEQGLFRIHFMSDVPKLHAGSKIEMTLPQFAEIALTYFLAGAQGKAFQPLAQIDRSPIDSGGTPTVISYTPKTPTASAVANKVGPVTTYAEDGPSMDGKTLQVSDWINAFDHPHISPYLVGCGILQPKPTEWIAYGSNHIRKIWQNWTLSENPKWARRTDSVLSLPPRGGAIGYYFATTGGAVSAKGTTGITFDPNAAASAATAAANAGLGNFARRWLTWRQPVVVDPSQLNRNPDSIFAMFPFPTAQVDDLKNLKATTAAPLTGNDVAEAVTEAYNKVPASLAAGDEVQSTKALAQKDVRIPARVAAVELTPQIVWERMAKMENHPIRHCATIGKALHELRLNDWIKEHFLHQLIRIFNEVRNVEMASTQISCPGGTNPFPMMRGPNGELVAVPLQQAVTIDPSSGQMVYDPRVAADMTRCVLPGTQKEPPPVPGVANARLGAEFGQ